MMTASRESVAVSYTHLDRAAVRVFAQYRLDRPHARVKALVVKYLMQPAGNGKLLLARRVAAEIEKCVHGQAERAGQRLDQAARRRAVLSLSLIHILF